MRRGKEILSLEDHQKVALEIGGILNALSRIMHLINGKVPVKILDQLLSFRGVDKALQKLRCALEDELARQHPRASSLDVYYPNPADDDRRSA
jgi:hypothetical protein